MFEAKLQKASLLKRILESVKELVVEVNFDCGTDGMQLQAMDTSHVALISLFLKAEGFESFRCDRNTILGINMLSMSKVIKCANNDDSVTIRADDGAEEVSFLFEGEDNRRSDFTLKLLQVDQEHVGIPPQEYKAVVKMPSAEFQRICRDLSVVGDTISIAVVKSEVKFSVAGDMGKGNVSLSQGKDSDKEGGVTLKVQEPVSLTFALRFLIMFSKASSLCDNVVLSMNPDLPLVVQYDIEEMGFVRYYLAPKIEDDGDN
eukprot:m51a1_g13966 Proliferating cell nuclear antigen (260) ;mRNA; f:971626-972815